MVSVQKSAVRLRSDHYDDKVPTVFGIEHPQAVLNSEPYVSLLESRTVARKKLRIK